MNRKQRDYITRRSLTCGEVDFSSAMLRMARAVYMMSCDVKESMFVAKLERDSATSMMFDSETEI